jgi:aspartyl-tRNA(Asn)/glutamyl-tRNA(Gln) amidotransferase subunit C
MSTITPSEVQRIAALARLGLTDEETKAAAHNLGNILNHFSVIQKVNTQKVPMADDVSGLHNVVRNDEALPNVLCSPETLLAAAPLVESGHIKVKAVF